MLLFWYYSNVFCCLVDRENKNNYASSERSGDKDLIEDREVTHEEWKEWTASYFPRPLDGSESDNSVHSTKSNSKNKQNEDGNDYSNDSTEKQDNKMVVLEAERAHVVAEQQAILDAISKENMKKSLVQADEKKQTTMGSHFPVRLALKGKG